MAIKKEQQNKKKYEKPSLRVIELAAEEVLVAGCKTISGGSAVGSMPCTFSRCSGRGS